MSGSNLNTSDREFFSRITNVIFANPFSDTRESADREVIDVAPSATYEERTRHIIHVISARIDRLISEGKDNIKNFSGRDRTLIENGFLFHVYLKFYPLFDELIGEQINEGESICRVPFARDAISMIVKRGFSAKEAVHYFAIFFQMRRAYYFIKRSIIGRSSCIKELRLNLWNNVFTRDTDLYARYLCNRMEDYSTLLLGETGTGKGIAAISIGRSGYIPFDEKKGSFAESFSRAFVSLNLSQFPEQLIESELFGHKKGAFTGAVAEHSGVFSRCSPYGAVLLDEIGEISVPLQIKLLQVLQERIFSPVGSHRNKRFRGRVIAATNRSIQELRSEKIFRDDFFYRLCSDIISVPPLRQRIKEDSSELDELIDHSLKRIVGQQSAGLTEKVRNTIHKEIPLSYSWPGNVRELEQCIRRILLKDSCRVESTGISGDDIQGQIMQGMREGAINAQQVLSGYCKVLYEKLGTYEAVARQSGLDRRTVKKNIALWEKHL